jgi:hypothetical protein
VFEEDRRYRKQERVPGALLKAPEARTAVEVVERTVAAEEVVEAVERAVEVVERTAAAEVKRLRHAAVWHVSWP